MAEVTRERTGQIITVLEILRPNADGLSARDVIALVEQRLPPTPFELSDYPNNPGVRRFDKIVRFSTITAVKSGWLVKQRGTWQGTAEGFAAIDRITDPAELARERVRSPALCRHPGFRTRECARSERSH